MWAIRRQSLVIIMWIISFFLSVHSNSESDALISFKSSLSDPNNVLASWVSKDADPCFWFRVTCNSDNHVIRIDLGSFNLSGQLAPQLGSLSNLVYLELYSNKLSGKIPPELGNLKVLVSLDLYHNKLSGQIPNELGNLTRLRYLRLNNNTLSGAIPMSLTTIYSLQLLDLSFNNLSGIVPVNGSFVAFNQTSSAGLLVHVDIVTFTVNWENNFLGNLFFHKQTTHSRKVVSGAIAGGIAAALLLASLASALVWWGRRNHQDQISDRQVGGDCEEEMGQVTRFSFKELQDATDDFNPRYVVGAGGFGKVYKGWLADGSLVAVKRLKHMRNRVEEVQFQREVETISRVVHRNLIQLRGLCMTSSEKLLVYPYMANGSVALCLQVCQGSQPLLDWRKRRQIALGSARGLAHLHHECVPKIIHRDVKAANILVDDEFEAVVGDFGLAKLMGLNDTHVTTAVRGTIGHIAPEYFSNGKCSEKADIFGYGIMLLELITGLRATDLAQLAIDDGIFLLHDWKDRKDESLPIHEAYEIKVIGSEASPQLKLQNLELL
ncbi:uncharacterized protein [Phyllobates terribilis]|uniref:uncharacterized protein n=1 Tax=Phyllobates terribilis TaxID=111132 RepID=UPI003CCB7304